MQQELSEAVASPRSGGVPLTWIGVGPVTRTALRRQFAVLSLLSITLSLFGSMPESVQAANHAVPPRLWKARYDGPGNNTDGATALGVRPDGKRLFVTGYSVDPTTSYDYATVAYDAATGRQRWVARYNPAANDLANALAVSPDGATVIVTGQSFHQSSRYDYATVAYDAASGKRRWVARYNGPGNGDDVAYALGVSPDGARVSVTGYGSASTLDYATVAYGAKTGMRRWTARYKGSGNGDDGAFALGVSPDGGKVFVTGYSIGPKTFYRLRHGGLRREDRKAGVDGPVQRDREPRRRRHRCRGQSGRGEGLRHRI